MPLLAFPFRYRTDDDPSFVSPSVLADPNTAAPGALDPSQVSQAPSPLPPPQKPIPKPPVSNDTALTASLVNLPPLNPDAGAKASFSGLKKVASMPPPQGVGDQTAARAVASAPPLPAQTPPQQIGMLDRGVATTDNPNPPIDKTPVATTEGSSTSDKLAQLHAERPDMPHNNWAQNLGMAILAMTKLGPHAMQIIHPKWSQEMAGYEAQLADTEAQQKEEETQAGTQALVEQREAQAAYRKAQSEQQGAIADARTATAQDRAYKSFVDSMGKDAVQQGANDPVPPGYHAFADPKYPDRVWVRQQAFLPIPKELLPMFPGAKENDMVPSPQFNSAVEDYRKFTQAKQMEALKAGDRPASSNLVELQQRIAAEQDPAKKAQLQSAYDQSLKDSMKLRTAVTVINQQQQKPVPLPSDLPPVAPGEKNEAYLQLLPAADQGVIKSWSDGRAPLPSSFALKDKTIQKWYTELMQYDPNFQSQRLGVRNAFTYGKESDNNKSLNTLTAHLDTLHNAMVSLDNGNVQAANSVANYFANEFGDPRITDFELARAAVASELATALKGQATDKEIELWKSNITRAQSSQQLQQAIHTPMELMAGRLGSSEQKFRNTMGEEPGNMVIYPYTRNVFQKFGVPLMGSGGNAGTFVVKAPNGKTYHFKDQQSADAFKKNAGIQ